MFNYMSGATSILVSNESDDYFRNYLTRQAKFDEADMFSAPFQQAMIHLPRNDSIPVSEGDVLLIKAQIHSRNLHQISYKHVLNPNIKSKSSIWKSKK